MKEKFDTQLKTSEFALSHIANGFILFSKKTPEGEYHKTDEGLLAAILDIDVPILTATS